MSSEYGCTNEDCTTCSYIRTYSSQYVNEFYEDLAKAAKMGSNPDPDSYIQSSARLLAETLLSKNEDYRVQGEFSNFERAADFSCITVMDVLLTQIAIKFTRIQGMNDLITPNNESVKDSLLDLAGYAIIAHAWMEASDVE